MSAMLRPEAWEVLLRELKAQLIGSESTIAELRAENKRLTHAFNKMQHDTIEANRIHGERMNEMSEEIEAERVETETALGKWQGAVASRRMALIQNKHGGGLTEKDAAALEMLTVIALECAPPLPPVPSASLQSMPGQYGGMYEASREAAPNLKDFIGTLERDNERYRATIVQLEKERAEAVERVRVLEAEVRAAERYRAERGSF